MQNLAVALFDAPHEGHRGASGVAHPSQNFAPSGFSEPQFEQRIESPGSQATSHSSITQCRERAASRVRTRRPHCEQREEERFGNELEAIPMRFSVNG